MKNRIYISAISFLIMVSGISCKKFLEENPKSLIAANNFYKTVADANAALNGVYQGTRAEVTNNIDPIWIAEVTTDDCIAGGTPVSTRLELDNLTYTSQNAQIQAVWNGAYTVINRANLVLANVDSAVINPSVVRSVHAQAKFLRALYYTRLVQFFGDVPLLTQPTDNENLYPPRTAKKEVYDQIIADLQYAEIYLADKYTYTDPVNGGRATKGAAKTLLGYVYLVMSGYPLNDASKLQLAADKFGEIITKKATFGYEILPNYKDIYDITKKATNTENIFYIQGASGLATALFAGTRLEYWYIMFNAIVPSTETINTLYEAADIRKTVSVVRKTSASTIGPIITGTAQPVIGKYVDFVGGSDAANDYPIFRYSDVLLMRAEALIELGGAANLNAALTLVNQVRSTHGGTGIPALTYTSQDDLRQKMRLERRRELLFEGKRWFDLVRWNIFVPVMQAHFAAQNNKPIATYSYITPNYQTLPLPYADFVSNPNLRPQNPGY